MSNGDYRKIKIGQTPGDLPPETLKNFPTCGARGVVKRKTRAQQRERSRQQIKSEMDEQCTS